MSATSFRRFIPGVIAAILGGVLIAATILREWGNVPYGFGVAAVAFGVVWVVAKLACRAIWRIGVSVGAAGLVLASGIVAVTGIASPPPKWETTDQFGGQWTARTGDLLISEGTARHVDTGEMVWEHDDAPDATAMLVDTELVVLGTSDGSVGVDPATGRQLWESSVDGRGIAYDAETLVIDHTPSEERHEAVAVDLATGEERWRQDGRAVMECDLGPVDRFSPAREQSHVLLIADEESKNDAALLDLAGNTTIAEVDCMLSALVVDEVLIEGDSEGLIGRSVSEGEELWSTSADEPWHIIGGGPTVFTPAGSGVKAIDVATGQTRKANPPKGTRDMRITEIVQRSPKVWALVVIDSKAAMWNPGTDELVEITEATSIRVEGSDVSSGWITLSGTTRDFTGEDLPQCWAFSQDGQLSEPIAERNCIVAEGLLQTNHGVHPIA